MKILGLDEIRNSSGELIGSSKSIVVLNKGNKPLCTESRRTDVFVMIFCTEGELFIRINTKIHLISSHTFAFILPNSIVQPVKEEDKKDRRIFIVAFKTSLLRNEFDLKQQMWKMGNYFYLYPTVTIDKKLLEKAYLYMQLFIELVKDANKPYGEDKLRFIILAVFSEIMSEYNQMISLNKFIYRRVPKGANIFQRFMEAVMCDDGTHRTVSYYADTLGYSCKHLSTIVKEVSGKTPLEIINQHAVEHIKFVLKHSDITIKSVSDLFGFSNASFFGKFIKTHVGMSPQAYRLSDLKEKD